MRVFGTIRATRKTGDKGVTVFHNLDADAISEVYIQIPPLRRKIVAKQRCSWHVCASCCLKRVFVRKLSQSNQTPLPAQIFGLGGVVAGSCWLELKTAVKRDAVLCGATCRKIFVFPTYESVAC